MGFWEDAGNFFSSVGDAIASGVEAVGNVVETAVNAVGDAAADIVETVGNGVQDGLNFIGNLLGGIPVIGGFLQGTFAWMGGIVAGVFNLLGAIVKGIFGILGGVIGGLIKIIGGILTLHWSLILDGLIDIGSSIVGAVLALIFTAVAVLVRTVVIISNERALTKAEKVVISSVFRNSLALHNIRIKSGNGMVQGASTLNNTIFTDAPNLALPLHTLVHECTHVWQYQNLGTRYLADALGAQAIFGRDPNDPCKPGNAYDWLAELNRGVTKWEHFNKEAAAQLITEIWTDGSITTNEIGTTSNIVELGDGAFYKKPLVPEDLHLKLIEEFIADAAPTKHCKRDGNDYTQLAIDSVKALRGRWSFRLSQFI